MANNGRFEYTIGFKTDDSGLKQARKALQDIQNLTTKSPGMEGMDAELANAKYAAAELETALTKAFNVKMGTTSISKLNQELGKLNLHQIYSDMSAIGTQGEAAFNQITVQAMKTNLQIKKGNTILEKFGKTLWRNVEWLISGNLINTVTGVFTKAYGFTKNLDSSLNDIRIVTGKSADEMSRFGEEAQKVAAELGKGTTDITNASLIFYQQGLDQAEVNARTEVTAKMSNVTKQSAETVADQMTAIWNGFKVGSDELEHYADVMTAIAASTASSSQELAGSISKVASIANTTGVDMEQLSAMISTVISVTRDSPETVGTAFKTIFARINDLVEDGTDEFGVSLGRVSSHLAAMGIEILNEDGTLRDLGDTLTETGEKWSSYSREQQIAIAEQMGGKRQWNQVLALFDNWNMYSDALDVAKNSTGALQEQQDIYMESTEAHLQAVKTAWEGVYSEMMTADNINTVADVFADLLEKVQSFIQAVGGIKPLLTAVAALMPQIFSSQIANNAMRIAENFKIMSYNKLEQSAQQALTAQFGSLNSSLMKELSGYHQKILQYQKEMTPEQQKQYESLLEARVEAENKYKVLKQENDELDALLSKYTNLNKIDKVKDDEGKWNVSRLGEGVGARQEAIRQMTTDQSVTNVAGRNVALGWTEEDQQQTSQSLQLTQQLGERITSLTDRIKSLNEQKQQANAPEEKARLTNLITGYSSFRQELQLYSEKVRVAADGTKESAEALKLQHTAVNSAKGVLIQLKQDDSYSKFAQGIKQDTLDVTGALEQCKKELNDYKSGMQKLPNTMESAQAKIKDITTSLKSMADAGVLTEEEVKDLIIEYENFGKTISKNISSDAIGQEFERLKQKVLQTGKITSSELEKILDGIKRGVPQATTSIKTQLDNIKASMKDFVKNLDFSHVLNNTIKIASAMGQMVSISQQMKSIASIWNDKDVELSEKIEKSIQNLAMMVPMAINAFRTFYGVIAEGTIKVALHDAAMRALNLTSEKDWRTKAKGILVARNKTEADAEEAVSGMSLAEVKELVITTEIKEMGIKGQLIAVQERLAASTLKLVAATALFTVGCAALILSIPKIVKDLGGGEKAVTGLQIAVVALGTAITWIVTGNWITAAITGAIAIIVLATQKIVEAKNAAKEASEKMREQAQKYKESLQELKKELQEVYDQNVKTLKSFKDYDKVWDSFKQGKTSVEDLKEAIETLRSSLELTDEQQKELDHLLGLAEISGDYSDVNAFLEEAGDKTKDLVKEKRDQADTNRKETIAGVAAMSGVRMDVQWRTASKSKDILKEIVGKDAIDANGIDIGKIDLGHSENIYTQETYDRIQNEIDKAISEGRQYDRVALESFVDKFYKGYIRWEEDYANKIKDADAFEKLSRTTIDFTSQTAVNAALEEYKNTLSDEAAADSDQIKKDFLDLFPEAEDVIYNIELLEEKTSESLATAYDNIKNQIKKGPKWVNPNGELLEFDNASLTKVNEQLQEYGLNLNSINFDSLSVESLQAIVNSLKSGMELTEDEIKLIKTEVSETERQMALMSADWENVGNAATEFSKKLEKGMSDVDLQKLISKDEWADAAKSAQGLAAVFADDDDLLKALDLIQDPDGQSVEDLADAWDVVNDRISKIDMEQPYYELSNFLDTIKDESQYNHGLYLTAMVELDSDQAAEQIQDFLDADYSIDVKIDADLDESFNEIKDNLKDAVDLTGKIGEGFIVSADDLKELADAFPGVVDGMSVLSDGTIQLSQTAVEAAGHAAQEEINQEIDAQIQKIRIQNDLLQYKKDSYKDSLKAAQVLRDADYTSEQQLNKDLQALNNSFDAIEDGDRAATMLAEDQFSEEELNLWADHYEELGEYDKQWTKNRIANLTETNPNEVKGFDRKKAKNFITPAHKKGEYDSLSHTYYVSDSDFSIDNDAINDYADKVKDNIQKRLDEIDLQISGNNAQIKILESYKNSFKSTWENIGKAKDTTKDNTKAEKEAAEVKQEIIDLLNEEIDAYHDVNVEIERNTTALNRLQKAQEKASGKSSLKNLEDQIKAYDELNQSLEEKQDLNYTKVIAYRVQLESQGITFNEDGTIANYNERLRQEMASINADLEWYNNLGGEEQESYKDWINGRTKELDDLKELINNYETLWNKEIPDLADEIAENIDKQVELQLEIETAKIKIVVDEGSLKRTELEISKIKNHLQDTNILGNLTYDAQVLFSYRDSGEEKALKDRYEKLKAVVDEARMKGAEIDQRILDSFKTAQDEYLKYIQEAAERTVKIVTDVFDRLDKRIERQKTQIETINKIFEHDMNLVKLRYGDSAYQQLTTLYEARERVSKVQLQNAQVRIQAIQQALQQARENNLGDDVIQQYEDQLASALESQRQAIDDYLNLVKEKATNAIDEVFAHLDEQLSRTSLEEVKIEWDWTNRDVDDYYDTINAAYELEKLRNQMRKAINETDDVATQKALNDLMNDELEQLQQKDKLSKYDIERANALFDIEQKRAAFREAQNNKSKMRLRRDSSGNYSYQFVSDEDRVTSAMQDLADAQNSLYNIDKEAYKNNLDKMYEYYEEFAQKMKEAVANGATEEELLKIQEKYATRLGDLQQDLYEKANNLEQVALDERQRMTGESWEELAVIERNVLMGDIVPTWNTALATMMQHPDLQKFLQIASAEAIDIAQGATATVEATIQTNIGTSLEDLVNGADPAVDAISRMTESVVSLETELSHLVTILSSMSGITLEGGEVLQDITNSGKQYADGIVGLTTGNQTALDNTLQTAVQGWTNLISQTHQNTTETTGRTIGATAIHRREYPDTTQARIDYLKMVEKYKENIQNLVKALNLNEPIAAINSRIAAINKTDSQTVQPSYITNNIQAEFPAVNSAQEIQMALEMLMNQATQSAFNTLK